MQEARAQKLIHDTNSYAFQPATVLPNITSLLCLKLCLKLISCYVLQIANVKRQRKERRFSF